MNNVEIDDVYHHDFTTASEWEVFIARIEEIIHEWKLPNTRPGPPLQEKDFLNLSWKEYTEKLSFADVDFILKHCRLKTEADEPLVIASGNDDQEETWTQCQKDILNPNNDFVQLDQENLEIAKFYGVREFIVLLPTKRHTITDETRIKILLSSLTIAVNNTRCEVPAFVQVQEPWQRFYLGINVGKGSRVNFNMIHLRKIPPHCKHLSGLLTLFKQKLNEGCNLRLEPALVSIRFSYSLKDWTNSTWTQEPPDFDFLQGETLGVDELGKLPFGATFDPVGEFRLHVTWPQLTENIIVDSEIFSDLEPVTAPDWSLQVEMINSPACLLGEYLTNFLQICNNKKSLTELLGDGAAFISREDEGLSSAFNVLTESRIPTISSVLSKTTARSRTKNVDGPITDDVLLPIIYFLFPDADDKKRAPYNDPNGYAVDEEQSRGIKTCAVDGLVWRLAIVAAHSAYNLGGVPALAQLWHEFVQEIRFRWEKCILIPGVGSGFPDCVRTCLLHQKLQMMNCCIVRKKAREESVWRSQSADADEAETESEEDEDEFFECNSEVQSNVDPSEEFPRPQSSSSTSSKSKHLSWNRPTGRAEKHPSLKLLNTGDSLYLPITQDPVPKTEDQLEEDAQLMMELGTDKLASEMRARLMSASLLSDMESFKAANPGAVLEDFIRWYSPRDWIEDDTSDKWGQPAGHLSARMMIPNNPWSTTWNSAQPVPAHRQKRLFDDTREAEKALHYLATKRIGRVAELIMPVLAHAALFTLDEQKVDALPTLPEVQQSVQTKLQYATKPIHQKLHLYEEIIRDIESVEAMVAQVNSLQLKLGGKSNELTSFLIELMRGKEVSVPNGPTGNIGTCITKMFCDAQKAAHMVSIGSSGYNEMDAGGDGKHKSFPEPTNKEFILRTMTPRPFPSSQPQPQRLYVCVDKDSIRMAAAFSEDTIFY